MPRSTLTSKVNSRARRCATCFSGTITTSFVQSTRTFARKQRTWLRSAPVEWLYSETFAGSDYFEEELYLQKCETQCWPLGQKLVELHLRPSSGSPLRPPLELP